VPHSEASAELPARVGETMIVRGKSRFVAGRSRAGWQRSDVFGCRFRLERQRGRMNLWRYSLRMRLN